ncbi:MAG: hypothetical protein ACR2GW_14095 [Pyrinomonadaceae bacterium]|nr:hypothetical protein [Pyrinomonadaceae bacterium]MDQ3586487.1 hypothetical protein [Acidobacteriota bacterium]
MENHALPPAHAGLDDVGNDSPRSLQGGFARGFTLSPSATAETIQRSR